MPKRTTANTKGKYIEFRAELAEQFEALAVRHGRTFKDELQHAMERHLGCPPNVFRTITVPPLPPVEIPPPPPEPPTKKPHGKRQP